MTENANFGERQRDEVAPGRSAGAQHSRWPCPTMSSQAARLVLFLLTFLSLLPILSGQAPPAHGALRCTSCRTTFVTSRRLNDHWRTLHTRTLPVGQQANIREHPLLNGGLAFKFCFITLTIMRTSTSTHRGRRLPASKHPSSGTRQRTSLGHFRHAVSVSIRSSRVRAHADVEGEH
jgi:hypothetical protein